MDKKDAEKAYKDLKLKHHELQDSYKKYFPKVNSKLLEDLLLYSKDYNKNDHLYSIQVLAHAGTDPEKARRYFLEKTGQVPESYEKGTHYLVNMKITFELLADMQNYEEVKEINGDYVGPASSVSEIHRHRGEDEESRIVDV
ncbi:MAG: hypothetical protein ACPKQO_07455 [Nitrososphaeraceae archaeon]